MEKENKKTMEFRGGLRRFFVQQETGMGRSLELIGISIYICLCIGKQFQFENNKIRL